MKFAPATAALAGVFATLAAPSAWSQAEPGDWAYISAFPGALATMFAPVDGIHIRKRTQGGFDVELRAVAAPGTQAKSRHAVTNTDDCPGLSAQLAAIPALAASGQKPPPGPPVPDSGAFSLTYLAEPKHPVVVCCGGSPVGEWGDAVLRVLTPCWRDVSDDKVKEH